MQVHSKAKKRKPAEKQTFLRPEDRLELLEAINKSKGVMDDTLECGSAMGDLVHDAHHKLNVVARKLGYKQENWYSNFTL